MTAPAAPAARFEACAPATRIRRASRHTGAASRADADHVGAEALRIPALVRQIIESRPATRVDRAHFAEFGASEYVFEFVYYVLSPDYNVYMDTQEAINVAIVEAFEREGIEFAYPTRTIILAPMDRLFAAT